MSAKVFVERNGKLYEVVQCGKKCSFAKPGYDCMGHQDICVDKCRVPKWWRKIDCGEQCNGLREIPKPEVKIEVIPTTPDERSCIEAAIVSAMNRHTKKSKAKAKKESK